MLVYHGVVPESTRWLTEPEQHCWRLFLTACQSLFGAIDTQLLHDSDLPNGYYEILVHLSEAPDRELRMTQLAKASTYSKSRLSHAVARLSERGWVDRRDCPTDRRGQIARLTDSGYAALEAAAPGHVEQVRRSLIDALTPDQLTQLGEISHAILTANRADRAQSLASKHVTQVCCEHEPAADQAICDAECDLAAPS